MTSDRICLVPRVRGVGGMVSFVGKLTQGLVARGIEPCYDLRDLPYDAVLVIGGTRQIVALWRIRQKGIRIVQRLDGMNWVHKVRRTGLRHYLRAEYGNMILKLIRDHLVDRVVYQSKFARDWWERSHGSAKAPDYVVYNGVDLSIFRPDESRLPVEDRIRVLMVEGSIMGGYEIGLEHGVAFAKALANREVCAHRHHNASVELMIVGKVSPETRLQFERYLSTSGGAGLMLTWAGLVPGERIPEIDRSAHMLFSADVHAACPNSVIEAMATGTPVIGFDTGALSELVTSGAGEIVPYGGDSWRLENPDVRTLAVAAMHILEDHPRYQRGARARAEAAFGLDEMVDGYLQALLG
jgi:glycosyltransferase involved in cell wall biosynthesis